MDFEEIEILSESEIQELYNNELYDNNGLSDKISACPNSFGIELECYQTYSGLRFIAYGASPKCYSLCGSGIGWKRSDHITLSNYKSNVYYRAGYGAIGTCYGIIYCIR